MGDRCGATDKVHFIVRQKNPKSNTWYEHHLRDAPRAKADRSPHLYKAVINGDDTFAIYIDDEEAFSGSLMDALEPPLTPPKFSATFEGDSTAPFVESTNDRY